MAESLRILCLDIAASKTGALSVLRDFYADIKELDKRNEWFFITGGPEILREDPGNPNIHVISREDVKKSKFRRLIFDHLTGKAFIKGLKPDIVFSMQNTLPRGVETLLDSSGSRVRTVIYLHQPLGFQEVKRFSFFNKWEREAALYQHLISKAIDRSLKKVDKVIVQTAWMKEAVCKKNGIMEQKVDVIKPHIPDMKKLCKLDVKRNPSVFFYPAGSMIYKDHQCAVDAAAILWKRGIRDFRIIFTEKREALPWLEVPEELKECIDFRGRVSRSEMVPLYQGSVLLFPSYIETFGYPLAEARSLDVPVIAADTPFARELLHGYDRKSFFRVSSAEELAELMEKSIESERED